MNRYAQYAAFLSFALAMALLAGYYVMFHVFIFLGLPGGILLWAATALTALLFMAGMGLSAVSDNPSFRGINIALGVWTGFFLILAFILMFLDVAGLFVRWPDYRMVGTGALVLAAAAALAGGVNARFVRTRRVKVPAKGLAKPIRMVQLSDLHLGPVNGLDYFEKVIERTNRERPDIVLITGDFIDGRLADEMFSPINNINAPVFFCPGNHEEYVGMEEFLEHLGRTKARPLLCEKVDFEDIELAGIDFSWRSADFDAMISKVVPSGKKYSILMSHGPPAFDAARKAGFDLTLSGHTHGGQFWPFTGFGRLFIKYRAGMYERDGKRLFVTTGTGTWGPPLRLGSRSEMAIIEIGGAVEGKNE
jgi:predicted MPP superfamily phosphohydrolase